MSVFRSLLKMYIRCTIERAYSVFATSYALSMTAIASVRPKETNRMRNRVKPPPNPQARRPRAAQGKGGAVKDVTSESEDDGMEGVEWEAGMYGVRMTPAHPWYVGRGDDKCGGEVVYSIQDIRQLSASNLKMRNGGLPRVKWDGLSRERKMNWSMRRTSAKVNKPVARQLAPMISKFIRA